MEPEITLVLVFICSLITFRFIRGSYRWQSAGRIGMSAMLVITSLGHVLYARGMAMILPDFMPLKTTVIYLTGILEFMAAIGLLIPRLQKLTGWALIVFFIAITPSNIKEAIHHINIETGNYDGNGPAYLFYRIPLQVVFIAWIYFSALKNERAHTASGQNISTHLNS